MGLYGGFMIYEVNINGKLSRLYKCIPNLILGTNGSGKTTVLELIINNQKSNKCIYEFEKKNSKGDYIIVSNLDIITIKDDTIIEHNMDMLVDEVKKEFQWLNHYDETLNVIHKKVKYSSKLYFGVFLYLMNRLTHPRFEACVSIIDEIESNLHLDVQCNVLDVLQIMFPNDQFIVTTHSPSILKPQQNNLIFIN